MATLTVLMSVLPGRTYGTADPSEYISWWIQNYREAERDDPRIRKAYGIFEALLRVADRPTSATPSLYIFKDLRGLWALSLPNGPIVLSKDVVDFCYEDPKYAEARLAFVLGHEIAHQVRGDWWHYNFFRAIRHLKETGDSSMVNSLLERVRAGDLRQKEYIADDYGILYSALAGFSVVPMISEDDNFIEEWMAKLRPTEELKEVYPSSEERIEAIRARLQHIVYHLVLFEIGVRLYQMGRYREAIEAFETFLTYFPSREVFNDLGLCYYREALRASLSPPRFKSSISADPTSRAYDLVSALGRREVTEYRELLDKAIENFKRAVEMDPGYKVAHNNLGRALDLIDPYAAIGHFNRALKIDSLYAEAYNNRGISLWKIGQRSKALDDLAKAVQLDPSYADPLYNLGLIYWEEGDAVRARKMWEEYLRLRPKGFWSDLIRSYLGIRPRRSVPAPPEQIGGVGVDCLERLEELEEAYEMDTFVAGRLRFKVWNFPESCFKAVVWEKAWYFGEERNDGFIVAEEGYQGTTALGVDIGTPVDELFGRYGPPERAERTTVGRSYIYPSRGIAFDIVEGKVASWYIFRPLGEER